jgi:hypothetical protein
VLLFVSAALSFAFGGAVISALTNTRRGLAEMEGIGLAVLCAALGVLASLKSESPPNGGSSR